MKKQVLLFLAVLMMAACSSPRYQYKFGYYDYNSGRKTRQLDANAEEAPVSSPFHLSEGDLMASSASSPVVLSERNDNMPKAEAVKNVDATSSEFAKNYKAMTRAERKEFRKAVRSEIKAYAKAIKNGDQVSTTFQNGQMDNDLKMAIIFGAVGLVLTLFGGISEAFWVLGVIAIIVGVVFLIKWLIRQ